MAARPPASIISQGNFAGVDQGVDFRGRGPVPATDEAVVTDVSEAPIAEGGTYPFVIYRLLSGPRRGRRVYVAENIRPIVRRGQRVAAGQPVALARGSYPYIEEGWNATDTGWRPSAPYMGHGATPQGRDFWNYLRSRMPGGQQAAAPTRETLERLWVQAGGPPSQARIAAAVALAESGGRENAKHKNTGPPVTFDYGLWQINSSHGYNVKKLLGDPEYNAHAAVAVWHSQGWQAWATYTSGAYRQYLGQDPTVPVASRPPRPGSAGSGKPGKGGADGHAAAESAASHAQTVAWRGYMAEGTQAPAAGAQPAAFGLPFNPLDPLAGPFGGSWNPLHIFNEAQSAVSDVGTFLKWIAWLFHPRNILRIVEFTAGGVLLVIGLRFLLEGLRSTDEQKARSLSAKKKAAASAIKATPPGRALALAGAAQRGRGAARRARRHGRQKAQSEAERRTAKTAQKRARQPGESRAEHKRRRRGDDVPF